jgi:flagellar biosynthesis/type III secretory pathway chaperone
MATAKKHNIKRTKIGHPAIFHKNENFKCFVSITIVIICIQLCSGCLKTKKTPDGWPDILEQKNLERQHEVKQDIRYSPPPEVKNNTKPFASETKDVQKKSKPEKVKFIKTDHCHNFSDNDSIKKAREDALAIVQQKAVSLSQTMIISEYELDNGIITKDKIKSISAASIQKTDILQQKESLDQRRICLTIQAKISLPSKEEIYKKLLEPVKKQSIFPKNNNVIIKAAKVKNSQLHITAFCTKRSLYNGLIVTWYDDESFSESRKEIIQCPFSHKTITVKSDLPDLNSNKVNYELMLLD